MSTGTGTIVLVHTGNATLANTGDVNLAASTIGGNLNVTVATGDVNVSGKVETSGATGLALTATVLLFLEGRPGAAERAASDKVHVALGIGRAVSATVSVEF